jgi:hypothetical protein
MINKFRHPDLDDADQTLYGMKNVGLNFPSHRKIFRHCKELYHCTTLPTWLIQDFKFIFSTSSFVASLLLLTSLLLMVTLLLLMYTLLMDSMLMPIVHAVCMHPRCCRCVFCYWPNDTGVHVLALVHAVAST